MKLMKINFTYEELFIIGDAVADFKVKVGEWEQDDHGVKERKLEVIDMLLQVVAFHKEACNGYFPNGRGNDGN